MDLFNGKNLNKDIFRKIEKKDNFPNPPKEMMKEIRNINGN